MSALTMEMDKLFVSGEIDTLLTRVQRMCKVKLGSTTVAGMEVDDVVQETALHVFTKLDHIDLTKGRPSDYIIQLVETKIKQLLRKAGTFANLSVINAVPLGHETDLTGDGSSLSIDATLGEIDSNYSTFEYLTDIMENSNLKETEKRVFKLRSAGYTFDEIAVHTDFSKAHVNNLWHSALKKLDIQKENKKSFGLK